MRNVVLAFAVCLIGVALAVGQNTQQSNPPAQQPSQSQQASPSQPQQPSQAQPAPMSGDTTVSGSQGGTLSEPNRRPPPTPEGMQERQPVRASNNGGGLPWGWIVIGIVAVVILIALGTRGSNKFDRIEPVDKPERDDIRRAG
jgi:hypothetical protein